ncbi:MAG TPA: hypothetical protein VEU96_18145 [Bryobacteraceae bacterium]|nr:hypothetical protein [Bryobacteraceae bacterium]
MRRVLSLTLLIVLATPGFAQRVITTIAGSDWLFPGDGRPAVNAPLSGADGMDVAVDRNGNYYIADFGNAMVMRVGPDGIVNVIAGNGINFVSGDGGLAVNAGLVQPTAIAVDVNGNVYIAEGFDDIRKVTPNGIITTIAGTGVTGFSGDNGPAIAAMLNGPSGLAVDSAGNIYVADTFNNRIRKISTNGIITTIGGNGQTGSSGDGGSALNAAILLPTRLVVDGAGNVYFTESVGAGLTPRVRKIDTKGIISNVAGGGLDPSEGIAATKAAVFPMAVGLDSAGNLYMVDGLFSSVRRIDAQGIIRTIAGGSGVAGFGGDGGPALNAVFDSNYLPAVAVDPSGVVYVADSGNKRIRTIGMDGIIRTAAGNSLYRFSGDGGVAGSATLNQPTSVSADTAGSLFLTEQLSHRIRRIAPDGTISVYAGTGLEGFNGDNGKATDALLYQPSYLTTVPGGFLLFSDTINGRVRVIGNDGSIGTYAGNGNPESSGDNGPPLSAGLFAPMGVDFDSFGSVAIAENQGNRIRLVDPNATTIFTLAGDGKAGFSGDGGDSRKAEVNGPTGLRFYKDDLYFCDSGNNRVRKIDQSLKITTVAGNGTADYTGDGGLATAAALNHPQGINFDAAGNMYIGDTRNSVIRMVTPGPGGIISTFAGKFKSKILSDGVLATDANLGGVTDLYVAASGAVVFTDAVFNRVRAVLASPPTFQATPATLAFTAPAGSTALSQNIVLNGSISGLPYTATSASSGWLQASPSTGVMPATIQVTVDPSKLAAGANQGSVTITSVNARPSSQTIQVTLTTTAPGAPSLSVKPNSLTFSYVQGSPASSRTIAVSNLGGGSLNFTAVAATTSGGAWLKVSQASGILNAFASTQLNVTADPSVVGNTGTYSGTLTLASANPAQSIIVPVTMTVTSVQQTILIPQTGLTFFAVQGGGAPPPQFFSVLNTGRGQMQFSTTAATLSGGSWLSAFPANGLSDASSVLVPQVRIDVKPAGLTAGVYYGTVQVTAPNANNTPQFVSVVLNVLVPGSKIGPIVQPTGLIFTGVAGGASPSSQTVTVQNTDSATVSFVSGRITVDGANWFTSLPAGADVTQSQPVRIVIQPQIDGLTTGVYRGTLTLSFSDGNTRTIALVLVLIPPGSILPHENQVQAVAGCNPKVLAPVFTQISSGFAVPVGFPGQVAVKVVDDCANPMTTGDLVVSFSNGDAPIRLISLKDGNWAGTWTPVKNSATVTITADASIADQNLKGQVQVRGTLQANDQQPVVGDGAVVNGASFAGQAPLAPGSLISIFGTNLAQGQASASTLPLPTNLAGSSIVMGGQQVPLVFASSGQVNAMVPYGLGVNTSQQVILSRGNSISVPQAVTLAPAAPGIFQIPGSTQGIIVVGADVVDATHPVQAGGAVVIYCTGLGEVTPAVQTGSPASMTQLSYANAPVSVTIGGVTANVLFAGLTPGFVGLYQVNAVVPAVTPGSQVPVVVTAAGQQSKPVTIVVR